MATIRTGDRVPDVLFSMHTGEQVTLGSYRGKQAIVVYFYPKDNTPICTQEACAFRDAYEDFLAVGADVIGVSPDSERSHYTFRQRHRLQFFLASDVDGTIRRAFGVPKTMAVLPGRVTYVIDDQGIVQHIFIEQLFADRHVKEALNTVRKLTRGTPKKKISKISP